MTKNLENLLLEIELLIKKEEWDKALELYQLIHQNWEELTKDLDLEKANQLLKIVQFLEILLKEKLESLLKEGENLRVRQKYTKFL